MKTIFRIIIILFVAAVIAGAFSLAVNNNSTASGTGQPPTSAAVDGQQLTGRPEGGDHDGGSGAGGLAGVIGTVLKLTGITVLVLTLQKGFTQLSSLKFAQR